MYKREIKLSGHIIDSLTLPKTMDIIMDNGGDFDILEFDIGKQKSDISTAKIMVSADSPSLLDRILDELSLLGVSIAEVEEVTLVPSPKDKVAPEGFYSTSHHVTHIYYKGEWILVKEIEMDCLIVVNGGDVSCKPIADIKEGDLIVVGRDGVKITPPQRSRGKQGVFEFMNSDVSSEKPMMSIINEVASEIKSVKANGGKIALVGGPAIVHTGSAEIVAQLIKEGIIDVIFAGNALATHDIECDQFGTSLGVCVKTGEVIAYVDSSAAGMDYKWSPVTAPISGSIIQTPVKVGQQVSSGTVITKIGDIDNLQISASIPERYVGALKPGLKAEISLQAYPDVVFDATVSKVSPVLDPSSRTKTVILTFDKKDSRVNAGMFAKVKLYTYDYPDSISIPQDAIVTVKTDSYLYVAKEDNTVEKRLVTLGPNVSGNYQIKTGINPNERVVVAGMLTLTDGAKIKDISNPDAVEETPKEMGDKMPDFDKMPGDWTKDGKAPEGAPKGKKGKAPEGNPPAEGKR